MPLQDYFNPNSMNPATQGGWQPQGAAAGLDYYNRQKDYQDALGLQRQAVGMDLQKQQGQLEDFQAARPSGLAATIAGNTATAENVGTLKAGEAQQAKAKGEYDFQTLNTRINDLIGSNDEKQRERGVKAIEHGLQVTDLLGPAVESGDKALVRSIAKGAGVKDNNPMIEHILNDPDPTAALAKWRAALEGAQGRSKAGSINLKGSWDVKERNIMADAQRYTADRSLEAAQYRTDAQKHQQKLEALLAQSMNAYFAETDPVKKKELAIKIDQIEKMANTLKSLGAPYSPSEFGANIIGGQTPNPAGAGAARAGAVVPFSQRVQQGQPVPQGQPGQQLQPVTQQQVEAKGERYQPDKYDYAIIDGVLKKRAK